MRIPPQREYTVHAAKCYSINTVLAAESISFTTAASSTRCNKAKLDKQKTKAGTTATNTAIEMMTPAWLVSTFVALSRKVHLSLAGTLKCFCSWRLELM